jgi:hypothetical protein
MEEVEEEVKKCTRTENNKPGFTAKNVRVLVDWYEDEFGNRCRSVGN